MKHHLLITLLFLFAGFTANAQGTKEDYKRAYSLESKFGEQNVRHWAHRIAWKDSTHVLTYYIDGDSGRVYYEYDAETKTRHQVAAPQEPRRCSCMAISTRRPTVRVAATTTAWTRYGGMSNGWGIRWTPPTWNAAMYIMPPN